MNRTENLQRFQSTHFDICIIGAGVSGAGCALDAALRGYKVALIEKGDFASETSSKSTKLIHGGVRYLEQAFKNLDFGQLRQVRHGLEERHIVLANAPHLAHPLALITPVSSWIEGLYYSIGLKIYDWFSGYDTLPKSQWLSKAEMMKRIPTLNSKALHSGVLYYDGQLDDARYCLAIAQSASENGVVVANYLEVTGFDKDLQGKLTSAAVYDRLSENQFSIHADLFINCTGPFSDTIRLHANPTLGKRLRTSKGIHAVLPLDVLGSTEAMLIPKTSDGRVVFAIPFEGELLLGTTDTEYSDLEAEPLAEKEEIDFLLDTLGAYLAVKPDISLVKGGFAGVRPLLAADAKSTKRLTRDHEVEHDPESNLLSLLGGKWTTYRLMARDTIDQACLLLGRSVACTTETYLLAGGEQYDAGGWAELAGRFQLPEEVARHLSQTYGDRARAVIDLIEEDRTLSEKLVPAYPYIKAEVVYAARYEMASMPRDFLARRIRLEITDWEATLQCLPAVILLMATEHGWDDKTSADFERAYRILLQNFIAKAGNRTSVLNR